MALFGKRRGAPTAAKTVSLYYASDVHGSDQCWRKFLGAGRHYGVDTLIMGGDLTGKAIVPVGLEADGSFTVTFLGEARTGSTAEELEEQLAAIRFNGMYPWVASTGEIELARADPALRDGLFEQVIVAELGRWIELADERMSEYGIDVFVMPGNDDPWSCDAVINVRPSTVVPNGKSRAQTWLGRSARSRRPATVESPSGLTLNCRLYW